MKHFHDPQLGYTSGRTTRAPPGAMSMPGHHVSTSSKVSGKMFGHPERGEKNTQKWIYRHADKYFPNTLLLLPGLARLGMHGATRPAPPRPHTGASNRRPHPPPLPAPNAREGLAAPGSRGMWCARAAGARQSGAATPLRAAPAGSM